MLGYFRNHLFGPSEGFIILPSDLCDADDREAGQVVYHPSPFWICSWLLRQSLSGLSRGPTRSHTAEDEARFDFIAEFESFEEWLLLKAFRPSLPPDGDKVQRPFRWRSVEAHESHWMNEADLVPLSMTMCATGPLSSAGSASVRRVCGSFSAAESYIAAAAAFISAHP